MNKIILAKTTSAVFLAIVLVTGTIATILPSFMTTEIAQAQPYYDDDRMYNDYNSYGPTDYRDDKKKYDDIYGPTDYGMDKDKKPYGTDSYKSQYSSYEPDYKPKLPSYDKDDKRDKSKKDSSKVDINKLNCINTNLNINGNNAGNISIGNKGSAGGYLGAYSSGGGGYGGGYDGYKKDKGFTCVINNNNTNTNVVGGGNGAVEDECVLCFLEANITGPIVIADELTLLTLEQFLGIQLDDLVIVGEELTISDLCRIIEGLTPPLTADRLRLVLNLLGIQVPDLVIFLECLIEAGIIIGPI